MMAVAYYLLKVTIISGLLFGYYHLALKDKVFHQWNRFYLLASVVFSLAMPFISFTIKASGHEDSRIISALQVVSGTDELVAGYKPAPSSFITAQSILSMGYILVSLVMMGILLVAIARIISITRKYETLRLDDIHFLNTHEPGTPFSFFRYIFWNEDIDIHTPNGKRIFDHELVHVREQHSLDKIFLQFILVAAWINPFFWLIRRELNMIHEFIADRKSIGEKDSAAFAELILQTTYPKCNHLLSNPFFQNAIKRRLIMINKSKHPGMNYLSRISALIIAACILLAFTLKPKLQTPVAHLSRKIKVVIDAGHGGTDNGAIGGNLLEKNLNLQIASQVKSLNKNPGIEIILTRESDVFMNVKEKLNFSNDHIPDLFISIHINAAPAAQYNEQTLEKSRSGFDTYISNKKAELTENNIRLATILMQNLSTLYKTDDKINIRDGGLYILDNNPAPAVIVHCGYISNEKDRLFISNISNQKLIAENILKSIEQYFSNEVQINNQLSLQDTLPIKSATVKAPAADARKAVAPVSPADVPAKLTPTKAVTPADPKAGQTKKNTADPALPVNRDVNVISPVNTTSPKNNNSANVNDKQQQGTITVNSTSPGSLVRIRNSQGNTSDSTLLLKIAGPEPLYIVDGVTTTKNFVDNLDPNKVSSIEVLKGTEATRQYGESGKNGVVKIITK